MSASSPAPPSPELRSWVCSIIGDEAGWEPHPASGRSRLIWIVRPSSAPDRPLLLRAETGLGPFAGTEFTLAREATVLRSLAGTSIPVPTVHGAGPGHVLMDLLPGTVDLDLSTEAGRVTMTAYCRTLARLHRLDPPPGTPACPSTAADRVQPGPPGLLRWLSSPADHALLDLAAHRRSYLGCPPHAGAEEVFDWLFAHAPVPATRTSLLHGDAGPGNFLHADGRITGLIDWEMAHVGDPMDDLAWLWFRITVLGAGGAAGPGGAADHALDHALDHAFRAYAEASGDELDHDRINYYCLAVLARCLVATLVRQRNNPAHAGEPVERMTRLVTEALAAQHRTGRVAPTVPRPKGE